MSKPLQKRNALGIVDMWQRLERLPGGRNLFSFFLGRTARYTGTIGATVQEMQSGFARVEMRDRPKVRNHLKSIHAIALMNLGEVTTGLAVLSLVDGQGRGIVSNLEMKYVKKARGTITGTCHAAVPENPGSHDVIAEGILKDQQGDTVAIATATWKIQIFGEEPT